MEGGIEFDASSSNGSELYESGDKKVPSSELDYGNFGCSHYRRKCKIRSPCCNEIFDCRHCHNEAKVQQYCISCGACMGKYFCATCKFFDDDISKNQYHCDECGICRTGGKENNFHCKRCECCHSKLIQNGHHCVEKAMHHNCPVCFEFLFDSTKKITVLSCGHTIHSDCLKDMLIHLQYSCPICLKSIRDMSKVWEKLDEVVASTPMPQIYQNKMVRILCNDCGTKSEVHFHIVAHKCLTCKSYNTRQMQGPAASCSLDVAEMVGETVS